MPLHPHGSLRGCGRDHARDDVVLTASGVHAAVGLLAAGVIFGDDGVLTTSGVLAAGVMLGDDRDTEWSGIHAGVGVLAAGIVLGDDGVLPASGVLAMADLLATSQRPREGQLARGCQCARGRRPCGGW